MHIHSTISLVLLALALAACNNDRMPTEGSQDKQPVAERSSTDMLLGAAVGYMLGRANSQPTPTPAPQVTNIYQSPPAQPAPKPLAVPAPAVATKPAPAAPVIAPAAKPMPQAQPAPKPSYAGPSSYSSVRQSAPTYRAPAPAPSPSRGRR